jgi:serine protease AprX
MAINLQSQLLPIRAALAAAAIVVASGAAGCARLSPPSAREGDDAFDEIHTASYGSSGLAGRRVEKLPSSARKAKFFFLARIAPRRPMRKVDKIHPALQDWIVNRPGSDVVEVVVTFTDTVRMPRFPRLDRKLPRDHPDNRARLDSTRRQIDRLRLARAPQYAADTLGLKTNFRVTIVQTYWLLQAALIRIELGQVGPLSARPNVVYLRPNIGPGPPQADDKPENDLSEARARIGSDHYLELGYGTGWMALLDTGVYTAHWLLWDETTGSTNLCMVADCLPWAAADLGGYVCSALPQGATPGGGDTDPDGHGTSTAAILVGNGRELRHMPGTSGRFGGVTRATLDCFKVYAASDNLLRPHATFLGFQAALGRLNQVVVAEMQDTTEDMADVARVADQAYEAGVVVVAANGNYRLWGPGVPARGKRVIGAGAFMLGRDVPLDELARGPTRGDSLIKPEILAPSHSETATYDPKYPYPTPTDAMHRFGWTSGATPYAAGAAFLLQNWLDMKEGAPVDPGQVYAHLLLAGDEDGPFPADDATGVGRMRLPETGTGKYGKTWVSKETSFIDVPIEIDPTGGIRKLTATIWWPESTIVENGALVDTHNDLNLEIISPGFLGSVQVTSDGRNGVFERASVTRSGGMSGTWILRIRPKTYRTEWGQVVYWGASLTP